MPATRATRRGVVGAADRDLRQVGDVDADAVGRGEEADGRGQDRADRPARAQIEGDQPDRQKHRDRGGGGAAGEAAGAVNRGVVERVNGNRRDGDGEDPLAQPSSHARAVVCSAGAMPGRPSRSARSSDTMPWRSARTSWLWIVSWFTWRASRKQPSERSG